MRRSATPILILLALAACAPAGGRYPSLRPRSAEAIDPRLSVERPLNDRPVTPAIAARLAALLAEARAGDAAFAPLAAAADRLSSSAGAPQGETWIVAQEALSAAVAARGPTVKALGDIDALGARKLDEQGGLAPSDLAAIERAAADVAAIEQRQANTIAALQRRLGI